MGPVRKWSSKYPLNCYLSGLFGVLVNCYLSGLFGVLVNSVDA
jgi:hypothetical protein